MKNSLVFLLFVLTSSFAIGQIADRVFINGIIYTANDEYPFAEALAISDDIIEFVGTNDEVTAYIGNQTIIHDLDGKLILPGLHDVHVHLLEASADTPTCTIDYYSDNTEQIAQILNNCSPTPNENGWIFGWGYSIYSVLESAINPKDALDVYFSETPVVIMEETSHSALVNSAALEVLGIDENTPDPQGGHIVKDEEGNVTGLLLDSAGDVAFDVAFQSDESLSESYYDGLVEFGLPNLAMNGLTSICEGRTYWKRNYIEAWQEVKNNNELTARVVLAPWAYPDDEDESQLETLTALYDEGDDFLKVSQVKLYMDGLTLNGTAAMQEPYVYYFGWPFDSGLNYFTPDRLETYITELELIGYDFHIHSIGNRGTEEALNAIEAARAANGDIGARHRLTHLEIVNPNDYSRFSDLQVIADVQVSGWWTQPQNWDENEYLIGEELSENIIPLKDLYEADAHVTISSDWDVSTLNPFRGIQNAVTRAPQNLPSVEEAVKSYTIRAAYVMRHEDMCGSIEVGKWADLICVDQNIFEIPQNQIAQTNVTMTMVGGEIVHETSSFPTNIQEFHKGNPASRIECNPSIVSDQIQLGFHNFQPKEARIDIYSSESKLVYTTVLNLANSNLTVDVSAFSEGTYLVKVIENNKLFSKRFIVSR